MVCGFYHRPFFLNHLQCFQAQQHRGCRYGKDGGAVKRVKRLPGREAPGKIVLSTGPGLQQQSPAAYSLATEIIVPQYENRLLKNALIR